MSANPKQIYPSSKRQSARDNCSVEMPHEIKQGAGTHHGECWSSTATR